MIYAFVLSLIVGLMSVWSAADVFAADVFAAAAPAAGSVAQPTASSELYSAVYGKPGDPAVVFLHGGPGYNSLDFEVTTAQVLAERGFYVVVYDRRGEGQSRSLQENKYTFAEASADLEGLYQKYKLSRATLLGHSFGGTLGVKFALAHPDKVKQLVWIGSPLSYQTMFKSIQSHCRTRYEQSGNRNHLAYLDQLEKMAPDTLDYSNYTFMHGLNCGLYQPASPTDAAKALNRRLMADPRLKAAMAPAQDPVVGFYEQEHYTSLDLSDDLRKLKDILPVYGIYGDEDGLFDPVQLQAIGRIIGPERLVVVKGASHNVYADQQEGFISELVKWLK